ncbi:glycoside hydrolase family 13 protein [Saccharospirillum impatiens]|uniref:glycoside hydrolase family 13 protein n=1 Tax=Saccharospirillum impatiens TaxID=169438 RepID=UPI000417486D|nr:alpha-glucosidase [Saccharospirillum impatiens]
MNTAFPTQTSERTWWKEAVVYQIYPRSFMDSNGDGIGDLNGIISKLDYLQELGVTVLWLCPIFTSPNDDNGYDISDYQGIMADFGTLTDFDRLLEEAHKRGLRILLDLVLNHSSDEHPWFVESRSSKTNPKRDWYIWREGKNGQPPNNWESIFNESVWEYDATTDAYFMHVFSRKQPDLNWENTDMRAALYDMVRWWLDKGVDGFRIDAISHIRKQPGLPDMPNPNGLATVPSAAGHMNIDGVMDYISDLCANTFAHYDIMTVGEANGVSVDQAPAWVAPDARNFNMLFQFEQLKLWQTDGAHGLDLAHLKQVLTRWQKGLEGQGWNALFVENHDIPRIVSTWGDDAQYWRESATAIATLYFLMQGTPFIYQGQELGMTNYPFTELEQFDDVAIHNLARQRREQGWGEEDILNSIRDNARDNSRTPMQWDATRHGGFTTGTPWLAVNPNTRHINVASQQSDPESVLSYYQRLIRLRRDHPTLIYGQYDLLLEEHPQVFAYCRTAEERFIVLCNLSDSPADLEHTLADFADAQLMLGNQTGGRPRSLSILAPYEARVYRIRPD